MEFKLILLSQTQLGILVQIRRLFSCGFAARAKQALIGAAAPALLRLYEEPARGLLATL